MNRCVYLQLATGARADSCGSQGRVTSYCGNELRKYTSYRGHASAVLPTDNAVRQMLVNDRGVVSLSARGLHFSIRRGLSQWDIQFVNPHLFFYLSGTEGETNRGGCEGMIIFRIFLRWHIRIGARRRFWLVVAMDKIQCLR